MTALQPGANRVPLSHLTLLPPPLLLALANPAAAQDHAGAPAATVAAFQEVDQVVYKGLVGNVLDVIPMDPSDRLGLQRTNAVVSNTMFGRSLAMLAGLSNPVLLVGGFVWGIWAASNIKRAQTDSMPVTAAGHAGKRGAPGRPVGSRIRRSRATGAHGARSGIAELEFRVGSSGRFASSRFQGVAAAALARAVAMTGGAARCAGKRMLCAS